MQVLFPPSYACYLPSRCCWGGQLCGWQLHCTRWLAMYCTMWLAIALYQMVGNVLYYVVGSALYSRWLAMYCARWLASVARRECKCFSSLFVWPGPLPLMKSKYRKSRHIHCNIFHTFATNVGDILKVLVKSCSLHLFWAKNIIRFVSMIIFPEQ